jgi:hypothetical protein
MYAVHAAAARGAIFVRKGLITMDQLEAALKHVAEGTNFDVYILGKRWITEDEIERVDKFLTTGPVARPNGKAKEIAHVAIRRVMAQHEETRSAVGEIARIASVIKAKAEEMPKVVNRERTDSGEFCCEP